MTTVIPRSDILYCTLYIFDIICILAIITLKKITMLILYKNHSENKFASVKSIDEKGVTKRKNFTSDPEEDIRYKEIEETLTWTENRLVLSK